MHLKFHKDWWIGSIRIIPQIIMGQIEEQIYLNLGYICYLFLIKSFSLSIFQVLKDLSKIREQKLEWKWCSQQNVCPCCHKRGPCWHQTGFLTSRKMLRELYFQKPSFVDTLQTELYPWLPKKQEKRGFPQQTHILKTNLSL